MTDSRGGPMVAGHQPNFFPWFGYFEKMMKCDVFVFSDDVQYPKQSFVNRVEIPVGGKPTYLTLPVCRGGDARIADKRFLQDQAVCAKLLKTLRFNFGGLPHFQDIEPTLTEIETAFWADDRLAEFNIRVNQHLAEAMNIRPQVKRGTELGLAAFQCNERLVERCRRLGSSRYLCGQGADGYQDDDYLVENGIALTRIDYGVGREVFGQALRYSVLYGLAKHGLTTVREAVAAWRKESHA